MCLRSSRQPFMDGMLDQIMQNEQFGSPKWSKSMWALPCYSSIFGDSPGEPTAFSAQKKKKKEKIERKKKKLLHTHIYVFVIF